jgi:Uma2 family endonuclease
MAATAAAERATSDEVASPRLATFEEYLEWLDEDTHAEWVEGQVVLMSPVGIEHQYVFCFLVGLLTEYAHQHRLGEVACDPFQMRLAPRTVRAPDLLFIAQEHLDRVRPTYLEGPADLVVELVSPGSRGLDRGDKYYEYELAGIREYWLVDPQRQQTEFYRLGPDGRYTLVPTPGGVFASAVLDGLRLRIEWLWTRPTIAAALREMGEQ